MSDLLDDDDLLSEDYRKKDDDFDDDFDEENLLYGSDDDQDLLDVTPLKSVAPDLLSSHTPQQPIVFDATANDLATQVSVKRTISSALIDSDSEGTDTRDETDDAPVDDNSSRKEIKIYRTISNVSGHKLPIDQLDTTDENLLLSEDVDTFNDDAGDELLDEDEESDKDEPDKRDRFKSERSNKQITISSSRSETESRVIPDTLEISDEARQKIEDFNKQQSEKRNKRFGGKGRRNRRGNSSQPRFMPRGGQRINQRQKPPLLNFPPFRPMLRRGMNTPHPPPLFHQPPPNNRQPNVVQVARPPVNIRMFPPPQWNPALIPPHLVRQLPPVVGLNPNPLLQQHPPVLQQPPPVLQQPPPLLQQAPPVLRQPPPVLQHSLPAVISSHPPPATTSSIPVVSATNRTLQVADQNVGNPIPTLMSASKRTETPGEPIKTIDLKSDREVLFNKEQRKVDSPKLSVKITRSRSRSSSPVYYNNKRTVLRPRRSRSRSRSRSRTPPRHRRRAKSPKKRSRRRSRSYSPRRRSPRRSAPAEGSSQKVPGKILINPNFKGARNLLASTNPPATSESNPVSRSAPAPFSGISHALFSIPPPMFTQAMIASRAPPPNMSVPPPEIKEKKAFPPPSVPPPVNFRPPISIPPPATITRPPPPNISVPPPNLENPPSQVHSSYVRPPAPPTLTALPPTRPPPSQMNSVPPPQILRPPIGELRPQFRAQQTVGNPQPIRQPPSNLQQRPPMAGGPRHPVPGGEPAVHIRPVLNEKQTSNKERFGQSGRTPGSGILTRTINAHNNNKPASRLKPPPNAGSKINRQHPQKAWKVDMGMSADADYQARLREQEEKRKKFLALKARKRGGEMSSKEIAKAAIKQATAPPQGPKSVKISNLASATRVQSIERMMQGIGPVDKVTYNEKDGTISGDFQSPQHAKEFTKKYNRFMVDLSYITVNLVG